MDKHDITYENAQARIRTLILMDLANELNGLVVGTGDLSELALGWCTYNGDQMSMYSVNAGIPKTLVRYLVRYAAENMYGEPLRSILQDIVDTPVSPELLPTDEEGNIAQKTEDKVTWHARHSKTNMTRRPLTNGSASLCAVSASSSTSAAVCRMDRK